MKLLCKRALSALLALVMLFSVLPIQALALEPTEDESVHVHDETCDHDHDEAESASDSPSDPEPDTSETDTLLREMADILALLALPADADEAAIAAALAQADDEVFAEVAARVQALDERMAALTDAALDELTEASESARAYARFYSVLTQTYGTEETKYTTPNISGVTFYDDDKNGKLSGTTVTITGNGEMWWQDKTHTVTITNTNDYTVILKFNYSLSGDYKSPSLNALGNGTSGAYNGKLTANQSITCQFTVNGATSSATLKFENVEVQVAGQGKTVTTTYDNTLGTVTVDGQAVTSGAPQSLETGAELVATPTSGAEFLGWLDTNGKMLSSKLTYPVSEDATLHAVFTHKDRTAWWKDTTNTYYSDNLDTMLSKYNTVVLAADGTLTDSHTIPSGKTLLIPFDENNECYEATPGYISYKDGNANYSWASKTKTSVYRKLTMASGANLTVANGGKLSLSAKCYIAGSQAGAGAPIGNLSQIDMAANSKITVDSGGYLYAWGYITGSGSVEAKANSHIYEFFQFNDFRGGTMTSNMVNNEQKVFPISQYYVQNIEVPLTLWSGAVETVFTGIYINTSVLSWLIDENNTASIDFIGGNDSMFKLSTGYAVKRYDPATDRLILDVHGTLGIGGMNLKIATYNINSTSYVLPINSNITINVNSGTTTIEQDIALLPGAEVNIAQGATCTLENENSLYVYDADQWYNATEKKGYVASSNSQLIPVCYSPTKTKTRTANDLVDAKITVAGTLNAQNGYLYTTKDGANICGTKDVSGTVYLKKGEASVTYQVMQGGSDNKEATYDEIPITSAKLKNADGSYVETATDTYTYNQYGKWVGNQHEHTPAGDGTQTKAPTCTDPGKMTYTCATCGETYTEDIVKLNHELTKTEAKAANCTEGGNKEYWTCSVCKGVFSDEDGNTSTTVEKQQIGALGHSTTKTDAKAANCTESGNNEYWTCSTCGSVFKDKDGKTPTTVKDETITPLGHDWTGATCTAPKTCTRCSLTEGDANGHDWTDATCTEPKTCQTCGATEGEANGHDWADATCTAPKTCKTCGTTEGKALGHDWANANCTTPKTCKTCKATEGEALGHDWADATCTEPKTCKTCKATEGEALGHDWADATCTEPKTCGECTATEGTANGHDFDGQTITYTWTNYSECVATQTCKNCSHTRKASTDGQYGTITSNTTTPATCTDPGTETYTATFSGEASWAGTASKDKTLDALGHDLVATTAVPATCTDPGNSAYWTCKRTGCGKYFSDDKGKTEIEANSWVIAALGHSYGTTQYEWTNNNLTCTAKHTCSKCTVGTEGHTESVSANNVTSTVSKPATCKTPGDTTYTATFDSTTYKWIDATVTTTATGNVALDSNNHESTEYTYNNLGTTHEKKYACCDAVAATEHHSYTGGTCVCGAGQSFTITWIVGTETKTTNVGYNGTPTSPFADTKLVKSPDATYHYTFAGWAVTDGGAALENIPVATEDKTYYAVFTATAHTPDHANTDLSRRHYCKDCNYAEKVEACSYSGNPTCTTSVDCTICGAVIKQALGHKFDKIDSTEWKIVDGVMTCILTSKCSTEGICHETLSVSKAGTLDTTKHVDPTCTADGSDHYTVTFDASDFDRELGWQITKPETRTHDVTIDALGHDMTEHAAVPPTCGEDGTCQYWTCSRCTGTYFGNAQGTSTLDSITVPATGNHAWSVSYVWSDDGKSCTATHICANNSAHNVTATANVTSSVTKSATCLNGGTTTYTATFNETWATQQTTTRDDVPATGHSFGEPTYTWQKLNNKWICTATHTCVCGQSETVSVQGVGTIKEGDGATCTKNGTRTYTATFTAKWANEGKNKSEQTETIKAFGHRMQISSRIEPTCTESGSIISTCSLCGTDTTKTLAALGHDMVTVNEEPATCTQPGHHSGSHCSRCTYSTGEGEISALGHDWKVEYTWGTDPAGNVTCTASATCLRTNCGITESDNGTVSSSVTKDPSCSEEGTRCYTAKFTSEWASEQTNDTSITKLDHVYTKQEASDSLYSPATCTEKAKYYLKCDTCGAASTDDTKVIEVGKPNGHSFAKKIASESKKDNATCEAAATYYAKCDNCNYVSNEVSVSVGNALGHDYIGVTTTYQWDETHSKCTATRVCTRNSSHKETFDSTKVTTSTTPSSCTVKGSTTYTAYFSGCTWASTQTDTVESELAPHTPDGGKITVSPFYNREGVRTFYCSVCGAETGTETVAATGKLHISVLGDSITAFTDYSNGSAATTTNTTLAGGKVWFPMNNKTQDSEGNPISGEGEITEAEHIWIYRAAEALGAEVLVNNSWSGSAVQFWQYGAPGMWKDRCVQLHANTGTYAGYEPDLIAVYMGTNDFKWVEGIKGQNALGENSEIIRPKLGTYADTIAKVSAGTLTVDSTPETTMDAYWISFTKMKARYQHSEIFVLGLLPFKSDKQQPTEFNDEIEKMASCFGVTFVDLESIGIESDSESFEYLMEDWLHPNLKGMEALSNAFVTALRKSSSSLVSSTGYVDVTYALTGVTALEGTSRMAKTGTSFTTDLKLKDTSTLMQVKVMMGSEDITESCYATVDSGKRYGEVTRITISNVTGPITIEATGHKHSYTPTVTEPTCTEQGYTTYTCSCGNTYKANYTNALDHSFTTKDSGQKESDATCTERQKNYVQCDRCDEVDKTKTIPVGTVTGHTYDQNRYQETAAAEATCVNKAKHYRMCDNCTYVDTTQTIEVGDPNGHDYNDPTYQWDQVDGAWVCTATHVCKVCSSTTDGHTQTAVSTSVSGTQTTPPTCAGMGTTTYTATFTEEWAGSPTHPVKDITKLEHSYGAVSYDWSDDGTTCTATRTCTVCDAEADGHTETASGTIQSRTDTLPNCTEKGKTEYSVTSFDKVWASATAAGTKVVDDIPANGHKWNTVTYDWQKDASGNWTCTATRVCKTNDTHTETATSTSVAVSTVSDATCVAAQTLKLTTTFAEDKSWAGAPETTVDGEAAKNHTYGDVTYTWTQNQATLAWSCTATHTCSVCAETVAGHTETATAAITGEQTQDPTCTEKGKTTYTATFTEGWAQPTDPTKCIHVVSDVPANGHAYGETQYDWTQDETTGKYTVCTATRVCPNCAEGTDGHSEQATSTSVYSQVTTYATCENEGETTYTARFAGTVSSWTTTQTKKVPIAAIDHLWNTVQYTWNADNTVCTASRTCQRTTCPYHTNAQTADSSSVDVNTVDATCAQAGSTTYTAHFTFEADEAAWVTTKEKFVPAARLSHEYGEVTYTWTQDETTGKWSCTATRTCTRASCTDEISDHTQSANAAITSAVTKKAKCEEAGETTYTASFSPVWAKTDDTSKTVKTVEDIPATGHTPVRDLGTPTSCSKPGKTEGSHCSVCGKVLVAQQEITQLDHTLDQIPGKKPTYTTPGYEPYERCKFCDYTTYTAIPALGEASITTYDEFLTALAQLEGYAQQYARLNPGKDPISLVIKYIRTGVERYNSGSWNIMAKYEDEGFAKYVTEQEDAANAEIDDVADYLKVSGLKNLENFTLPNGNEVDFGHMFGTMDISWTNKNSTNHADVGGWAGDLVDLMTASDRAYNKSDDSTLHLDLPDDFETMVTQIREQIFMKVTCEDDKFSDTDFYGDLDGLYIIQSLYAIEDDYTAGDMTSIIRTWCTASLSDTTRAEFFLSNRLGLSGTRAQIRDAVYAAFTGNNVITTLEGTREFLRTDSAYLEKLRKASCYAFADYICQLAGDYVDVTENAYYTDFYVETSTLAPGVVQEIHKATTADNKQIVYYLATADLSSQYVDVYANYNNCNPTEWKMTRVLDQAEAAQSKYGDPESESYIQNYQVVAAINSDGFNMSTGEPGGLLIMDGKEYHSINSNGFFGITKEGKAVIGSTAEYNSTWRGKLRDAVGGFGTMLVVDGEIAVTPSSSYYNDRNPRTAVGITRTGKVVFMVLDGRQEPVSCGGSMQEIAQIMREAGCVNAINLDGGGSTTYVSKPEGSDSLQVTSKPSDGYARSVSSTLMIVSTAPSSTAFDHARLDADYSYVSVGSASTITPTGVSATGNIAALPDSCTWQVEDASIGSISESGVFTGLALGETDVILLHEGTEIGRITMHVVAPTSLYFTRTNINVVYGASAELPIAALYEGKRVSIRPEDVVFTVAAPAAGSVEGFTFHAAESSALKVTTVTAALAGNAGVSGSITVNLFEQGDMTFDFDSATAGDRQLAWMRTVTNAETSDDVNYTAIDLNETMEVGYVFAMDMTQIPIPAQLNDLIYMLPGADDADASAWNFLLQLAERVSDLTNVSVVFTVDERFDVDVTDLTVRAEYFNLTSATFNESTHELTLVLNWIRQSKSIDAENANPLCIVSGLKLTPKDSSFDRISSAVNVMDICYTIYLRTGTLYSFACKEENQKAFGLYPFTNDYVDANGETKHETGGYLASDYKKGVTDQFSLSRSLKQGWYYENTGYAYYVDGEKLTGVALADGYYYDFGTDGINAGKTKYSGTFSDAGGLRLARNGKLVTSGWNLWDDKMYHCHSNGYVKLANRTTTATCTQGGYDRYFCTECFSTKYSAFIMPTGHDWDENHVCLTCGAIGKNIEDADVLALFAQIDKNRNITTSYGSGPVYFAYKGSSVNAAAYISVDGGKTALTQSNDATLNSDYTMRDIFVQWMNNKEPGVATVVFTGRGDYYGTRELEYRIMPGKSTLTVSATTQNSITLSWTAALGGADYYEVYYSTSSGYKWIRNVNGTSCTIEGLSPDTKYSFALCAHKSLTGQSVSSINSQWSNIVSATTNRVPGLTITFDPNGGTASAATSETDANGRLTALPTASRDGHTFDGWFTEATGGTEVTLATVFTADTTVYAHWTKDSTPQGGFTVTFNANGGTVSPASGQTGSDGKLASLPTPSYRGHLFDGWFTEAEDGTEVTLDTIYSANVTIYAHWTEDEAPQNRFTVTFNANGGTVSTTSSQTDANGTLYMLPTPTRDGYTFDGWFTAASGGEEITPETRYTANVTLYAHWTKNTPDTPSTPSTPTTPTTPTTPSRPSSSGTTSKPTQQVTLPFTDVTKRDWFYDDVAYVYENGIMNGSSATLFEPNSPLTRGMIVTILYRMENEPAVTAASPFTDVPLSQWYGKAVVWAEQNGIVSGYGNGRFGPNDPITREQLAAILYRYAAYRGRQTSAGSEQLSAFTDASTISSYAVPATRWAVYEGLMSGSNGKLSPTAKATRAQVAAIIRRFLCS